ncbi:MAG TPA: glycosyltransferase family 4 protein [Gemmataceae bacterium]|nr:glycosyltransferase family 4 protein [Gemmataceae bacterium]
MRPIRVLTWHVHGNYLLYLSRARVEFVLPVDAGRGPSYGGRGRTFHFGPNVVEVPAEQIPNERLDCILFQTRKNYSTDQYDILSPGQRRLPRIYLQHDPPWGEPAVERHWFDDPAGLLVHVTPFNALMWDSGRTPNRVIDHGVSVPESVRYTGKCARGIVVVNHLQQRGRRLGADIFEGLRAQVPLDLVGMETESFGGLGEIFPPEIPAFMSRYRFFFNPIRWTSLGLAIIEAMMVGLPIVGLATTELVTVIRNGESGFVETDPAKLVQLMHYLIAKPAEARRMGENARHYALERFGIERFARDWEAVFSLASGWQPGSQTAAVADSPPKHAAISTAKPATVGS